MSKLLINKPIVAWDEVLSLALFTYRIKAHTKTNLSLFKLVYGLELRVRGMDNILDKDNVDTDFEQHFETLYIAWHATNRLLLERAIRS